MQMTVFINTKAQEYQSMESESLREQWANDVLKHYLMKGYFANQIIAEPEKR